MDSKQILFLFFVSSASFTMHSINAMQATVEQQLFNGQISPRRYLSKIENGLYGAVLAQQMRQIRAINYIDARKDHPSVIDLIGSILNVIGFAIRGNSAQTPETIKGLVTFQIGAKHRMLMAYLNQGFVQMPSTSGSGD